MQAFWGSASIRIPIDETLAAHTVDVTFVPLGERPSEVVMSREAGVELLPWHYLSERASLPASMG